MTKGVKKFFSSLLCFAVIFGFCSPVLSAGADTERVIYYDDPPAEVLSLSGEGMVIAVIDSGFNPIHETMRLDSGVDVALSEKDMTEKIKNLGYGAYFNKKIPFYYNYAEGNYNIKESDNRSHGMHTAALAAGNSNTVRSYAKNAQLLLMRVFPEGSDEASDLIVAKAVRDAADLGADVINLSLGSPGGIRDNDNCYSSAVEYARERGCLVVAAAGNEGDANSTYGSDYGLLSTPGDLKNVLSVGAADKDGNVADFSSVGPLSDLSFGEKVYARGVGVLSADNEGYSRSSGTSFAAPKVSSAAALVMQRLKNIGMSGAELCDNTIALLENTSRPIADKRVTMSGIINVGSALKSKVIVTYNGSGIIELGKITDNMPVSIEIRSISDEPADLTVAVDNNKFGRVNSVYSFDQGKGGLEIQNKKVSVAAGQTQTVSAQIRLMRRNDCFIFGNLSVFEQGGQRNRVGGSVPFFGYCGNIRRQDCITEGNGPTDIALYSFDGLKYTKHSTISANGDGVNDFLFPFFFLDTAAEYVRVDIYSNNMKFISNAAYTSYLHPDLYYYMFENDEDPVEYKASEYLNGLAFSAEYFNTKTGEYETLKNGKYYAVVEVKALAEGSKIERHIMPFSVTDSDGKLHTPSQSEKTFGDGDIEFLSFSQNFSTVGGRSDDGTPGFMTYRDRGRVNVSADYLEINGRSVPLSSDGTFEYDFLLREGKYTSFRVIAKKNGGIAADRTLSVMFDGTAPTLETDLETVEIPDYFEKRLDGEFDGFVSPDRFDGRIKISGKDESFTPVYLWLDGVFVQLSSGCSGFDKNFYCTSKQKGDIISVGLADAAGNTTFKNYIMLSGETETLPGDGDFDGSVTVADALLALQQSVGKVELGVLSRALSDIDADLSVSVSDALMILQCAVGKISLPAE